MRTARDYHVKPVDNSAVYYTDVSSSSLGCNSSGWRELVVPRCIVHMLMNSLTINEASKPATVPISHNRPSPTLGKLRIGDWVELTWAGCRWSSCWRLLAVALMSIEHMRCKSDSLPLAALSCKSVTLWYTPRIACCGCYSTMSSCIVNASLKFLNCRNRYHLCGCK